jgi:16S rRNA (cytosine1402-N4)-methyltransferase
MSNVYHTPVLLNACIEMLQIQKDGTYVDLTFGGGGHSRAILAALGEKGRLFAFDQDEDARANVPDDKRFTLIPHNFRFLKNYLRVHGVTAVDGILGDFGVSSHQFDEAERGFSIRFDSELDMRMSRANALTARQVVNEYGVNELAAIFRKYAEINNAGALARVIDKARANAPIVTTADLQTAIAPVTPRAAETKFLARVFQALRIEVNQEIPALEECLTQCHAVLKPGGRLVTISYHSLEDRLVKNLIKTGNVEGQAETDVIYGTRKQMYRSMTSKPVVPDETEIQQNPRARSAKLRAAEKITN